MDCGDGIHGLCGLGVRLAEELLINGGGLTPVACHLGVASQQVEQSGILRQVVLEPRLGNATGLSGRHLYEAELQKLDDFLFGLLLDAACELGLERLEVLLCDGQGSNQHDRCGTGQDGGCRFGDGRFHNIKSKQIN